MIRRPGIIALLFCLLLSSSYAQNQQAAAKHEFSIGQCIEYGLKNNVQVKNAILDLKIQEQTNKSITASAYPQINGSIGSTYYPNVTVQSFPNFIAAATYGVLEQEGVKDKNGNPIKSPDDFGFIQAAFGTKWNASAGVSLSQILFDGQVFVGLQARQTSLDWQQKNIELTQENIKAKMYKNGFAEKIDVDRATVQLANLQTTKLKVNNTINNGYLGLKLLIGMPVLDAIVLTDSVTDSDIKQGLLNEGVYQYTDRKDYQYLQLGKRLNEYNIKRYKLSKLPTANLSSSYSKMAMRNQFNFFGKGDWFTSSYVGLNISIPIFSGLAKNAEIQKAALQLQQTQNQIDNLKVSIDNDVAQATNNFHNAVITLDYQKKNMQLAEQVYNQAKKKYEIGTGENLEITNAQSDLTIAQNNYISALYDAIIAKIDYLKAIGKL